MSKKALITNIQRVLNRAGIDASIKAERLSWLSSRGPRSSGWRVSAELPALTDEQSRALHAAVTSSVTEHYHPMSGALHRISTEGA